MTASDDAEPTSGPFVFPDAEEAVVEAVSKRAEEIARAADAGEPPVTVLIPDLNELISEGFYWRSVERKIAALLAVNRRPKRTPYRRPKGTPFVVQRDGYGGRAVRAGCGVGRA